MTYRNSPQMQVYNFEGVQLIPNNEKTDYRQRTYAADGFELEGFNVWVCDMCGNELAEISAYFDVLENYNDPDTGKPQILWRLYNVPFDAGYQAVYLKILQGSNDYKYSSPFYLTSEDAEFTASWHYGNKKGERLLSTQLKTWYKDLGDEETVNTYDPVTRGGRNSFANLIEFEYWQLGIAYIEINRLFKRMRRNTYVYCDFVKTSPNSAYESPRLEGKENFIEAEIELVRDYNDIYDPFYVAPLPPTPPVLTLVLNSVTAINNYQVQYNWTAGGFNPSELIYQWSLDGITWEAGYIQEAASPRNIDVFQHPFNNFYYSVFHQPTGLRSNALQLPIRALVFDNIITPDSQFGVRGNKYFAFWHIENSYVDSNQRIRVDVSTDGITFINDIMPYQNINFSPFVINTPASSTEFKYFRLRLVAEVTEGYLGTLTSNVLFIEI